jgi:leader peptidase (prepilin peptidase) / N-methyltransferase
MHIEPWIYALFGLVIGSFLNVCIYRLPLGKSVVTPRSACPGCGTPIRPYDNIPVLSWLILRGKCRSCGASISIQYPVVELLTAAAFFACAWKWDLTPPVFVNTLLLSVVIVLIFTDYQHRILPNVLTLPGIVAGIVLCPFQDPAYYSNIPSIMLASLLWHRNPFAILPWVGSILGAIVGALPLYLIGNIYMKWRRRQGLGMGDVKMMGMVGAFTGCSITFLTIMMGALLGTVVGIALIILKKANLHSKLAFGVFLGIATAVLLFFGLPFWDWYYYLNYHR